MSRMLPPVLIAGALVVAVAALLLLSDRPSLRDRADPTGVTSEPGDPSGAPAGGDSAASGSADRESSATRVSEAPERGPRDLESGPLLLLEGRVVFAEDGTPAAGASVAVHRGAAPLTTFDLQEELSAGFSALEPAAEHHLDVIRAALDRDSAGNPAPREDGGEADPPRRRWETRADERGRFTLEVAGGSRLTLVATLPLYTCAQPVRVGAETVGEVLLQLVAAGGVRGRVELPDGSPAAAATVNLQEVFDPFQFASGDLRMRHPEKTSAASDGSFHFASVPPGSNWTVSATSSGWASSEPAAVRVESGRAAEVLLVLEEGADLIAAVRDPDGVPVAGARVRPFPTRMDFGKITRGQVEDIEIPPVASDDQGEARFAGLSPQEYQVTAQARGFQDAERATVEVRVGETARVTLALRSGGELHGRVQDPDGEPVPDARVRAYRKPGLSDLLQFSVVGQAPWGQTTADGSFHLKGLPAGPLSVEAKAPDHTPDSRPGAAGGDPVTLVLHPRGAIEGIAVSRSDGNPVRELSVQVEHKQGFSFDFVQMGEQFLLRGALPFACPDGRFKVAGLDPGSYRLQVKAPDHAEFTSPWIEVKSGETTRGVLVYLLREAIVRGQVLDATTRQPIAGARVRLDRGRGTQSIEAQIDRLFGTGASSTADDGSFELRGVKAGTWQLHAVHPDYADGLLRDVAVPTGQLIAGLELMLGPGAEIFGTVTDALGRPAEGTRVFAVDQANTRFRAGTADSSGGYSITGLLPGRYVVTRMPGSMTLDMENLLEGFQGQMGTQSVEIAEGERKRLDFAVDDGGGGALEGHVTRAGEAVRGAIISVLSAGDSLPGLNQMASGTAVSRADGSYRVAGLRSGPAVVQVQVSRDLLQGAGSMRVLEVEILAEGATRLDLAIPGGAIRGRVVDGKSSTPLGGVPVYASLEDGSHPLQALARRRAASSATEDDGSFELSDLEAGTYRVVAGGRDLAGLHLSDRALTAVDGIAVDGHRATSVGTLRLEPAAVVRGVVSTGQGQPLPGAAVFLRRAEGGDFLETFSAVMSDGDGAFHYPGVPAGEYDVLCRAPGHSVAVQEGVRVGPGDEIDLRFELMGGTRVVLDFRGDESGDLSGLRVEVIGPQGHLSGGLFGLADIVGSLFEPPEPGHYPVGTFAAGRYTVRGALGGKEFEEEIVLQGEEERVVVVRLAEG